MKLHGATLMFAAALLCTPLSQTLAQTAVPVSAASDALAYRKDAARHIYARFADHIYKGMLPALVHAIVVVETEVDAQGSVTDVHVLRAPSHAPDVTQAVLDMIHQASPLPVPQFLGKTKFTEVWLVDHSGSFQLHALTEGQH